LGLGHRLARAGFGDEALDGVEDGSELLVVLPFHGFDLARELAIGVHQAA